MFRISPALEFFLVHPGGPHFSNKDDGHWTIPKGEIEPDELPLTAAQREFEEETGLRAAPPFIELGFIQQKGGKIVHAWAFQTQIAGNPAIQSNLMTFEWPPRSGRQIEIPEIDLGLFFDPQLARIKIKETQIPLLERLEQSIGL